MDEEIKKLIQNAKRRETMYLIMAALMEALAIAIIALLGIILDIPAWVRVMMGALIFAISQGMLVFFALASYENDVRQELERYSKRMEELNR